MVEPINAMPSALLFTSVQYGASSTRNGAFPLLHTLYCYSQMPFCVACSSGDRSVGGGR